VWRAALLLAIVLASCAPAATTQVSSAGPTTALPRSTAIADLVQQFAYDSSAALDLMTSSPTAVAGGTQTDISFASPRGGRAGGFIVVPAGPPPFPAVIVMGGSNATPADVKAQASELAQRGAIALAIDQSQVRPGGQLLFTFSAADREASIHTVVDLRRAIDVLAARTDVDAARIGYWGFSHGAFLGGLLAGVDRRPTAYVLQSGGGPDYMLQNAPQKIADPLALAAYRDAIASIDADRYVARAAPAAILFQNGTLDHTYTAAGVSAWTDAASSPKEIRTYPADHLLNADATTDAIGFLIERLSLSNTSLGGARGILAQAKVTRPAGPYFVSLIATDVFQQTTDEQREGGFELAVTNSETLAIDGAATPLARGHAVAVPAGTTRTRTAPGLATSYFMSLRPSGDRDRSLGAGRRSLYASADLPLDATPAGGYDDALVLLVLAPGQVVPPHMHGGVEPTYVIEGTVELKVKGKPVERLTAGQGDTVLPDTPLLLTNVGTTVARVLVMLATPNGKPLQTQTDSP
jgi:dienelactone hydrolase/mannose-6-phosphate isomerase-like protein (cupin superfamily)